MKIIWWWLWAWGWHAIVSRQCHTWTEMGAPFVKRDPAAAASVRAPSKEASHCKACLKTKSWLLLEQDLPIHSFSTSCHEAIFTSHLKEFLRFRNSSFLNFCQLFLDVQWEKFRVTQISFQFDEFLFNFQIVIEKKNPEKFVKLCLHLS